jgi:hypothetical protein
VLFPSPFDGRGIRERVKKYKRTLECNRSLSPSLSPANWRKRKKQIPLRLPLEKEKIKNMKKLLCRHIFVHDCFLTMSHLNKTWLQTIFE